MSDKSVYGFCPICGAKGISRERRPNGNDRCGNGHTYLSKEAKSVWGKKMSDSPMTEFERQFPEMALKIHMLTAELDAFRREMDRSECDLEGTNELVELLRTALRRLLAVEDDHMTACDRTMGATHPCTCGADSARELLMPSLASQRFFVEHDKGWYWVTERKTLHNYAQTDSKESAHKICRKLNAANLVRLAPL